MCKRLIFLVIHFYHALRVAVSRFYYLGWSRDSPLSPMGSFLGFLMVGELQLDQMSFNPLPFLPRDPHMKVTSRVSPWTLSEWCSMCIIHDQHSAVHTAPHLKVLYSQSRICKQARGSTFTSRMFVGPVSVSNPKFWYLQGSCPLVVWMPCLTGAGCSGLLWALLSHRWHWSWSSVIFDSIFRLTCLTLPHVRTDGK